MSSSPHDALFRRTFSDVNHAAAELRAVDPADEAQLARWSVLVLSADSLSAVLAD